MSGESKEVKALRSFETSGRACPDARPHIQEVLNPQYRGCENAISCVMRAGVAYLLHSEVHTYNLQFGYISVSIYLMYGEVYFRAA
jgi:hypothetical protein